MILLEGETRSLTGSSRFCIKSVGSNPANKVAGLSRLGKGQCPKRKKTVRKAAELVSSREPSPRESSRKFIAPWPKTEVLTTLQGRGIRGGKFIRIKR